jgi:small subunit ribosomal protein S21
MIKVTIGPNEDINRAITRFKRKCERAGILKDYKKTSYFIKPSQKRRLQKEKAIRRLSKLREEL